MLKRTVTAYNLERMNQSYICRLSRCLTAQAGELGHKPCLQSGQAEAYQRQQAARVSAHFTE